LTLVKDGQTTTRKVTSVGDWREFYANVRDVLLDKAEPLVTPPQVLDVMLTLELAKVSSKQQKVVVWGEESLSGV
jgi:hypothetical protein